MADEVVEIQGDIDPREAAQLAETSRGTPLQPAPVSERDAIAASSEALRRQIATQGEEAALLREKQVATDPHRAAVAAEIQEQQANPIAPLKTPPPIPVPDRAATFDQTVAKSLFATAALLSAIGLAGGRSRGMLAMSGLTGAINGFREGNNEKYAAGIKQYQEQIGQQIAQFKMMEEERKSILENRKLNLSQKLALLDLESRKWDDRITATQAERKDLQGIIKSGHELTQMQTALENSKRQADQLAENVRWHNMQAQQHRESLAETTRAHDLQNQRQNQDKRAPRGFYFDRTEGDFTTMPPTVGEIAADPKRYVNLSPQNADLVRFIVSVKGVLPFAKALGDEVLPTSALGSGKAWLGGKTAPFRASGTKVQAFKELRQALINEAANVENRSRGLTKYLREAMEQQFPDVSTNRTVAQGQFATMDTIIDQRLRGLLGAETIGQLGEAKILNDELNRIMSSETVGKALNELKPLTGGEKTGDAYPTAVNPKTGEKLIFKEGKWQKP